jgi:hypothetical protein
MADGTTYFRNEVYALAFQGAPFYLALYSDATTELNPTGYARQLVVPTNPVDGVGSNDDAVDFGAFTGAGGPITHAALFDAVSGGNRLTTIKALGAPSTWVSGFPVAVAVGDLGLSVQ